MLLPQPGWNQTISYHSLCWESHQLQSALLPGPVCLQHPVASWKDCGWPLQCWTQALPPARDCSPSRPKHFCPTAPGLINRAPNTHWYWLPSRPMDTTCYFNAMCFFYLHIYKPSKSNLTWSSFSFSVFYVISYSTTLAFFTLHILISSLHQFFSTFSLRAQKWSSSPKQSPYMWKAVIIVVLYIPASANPTSAFGPHL